MLYLLAHSTKQQRTRIS